MPGLGRTPIGSLPVADGSTNGRHADSNRHNIPTRPLRFASLSRRPCVTLVECAAPTCNPLASAQPPTFQLMETTPPPPDLRSCKPPARRAIWPFAALLAWGLGAPEASAQRAGSDLFESRIRPTLVKHCYACHSASSATAESGLRLDTRAAIRAGGRRGPAVVPGKPDTSWLLKAIDHRDPSLKMPPQQERLPASVIADFKTWIRRGAKDPRDSADTSAPVRPRPTWALRPLSNPMPPEFGGNWPRTDVDAFILRRLRQNQLLPSPDASTAALLRRLHFDLIGLPPTPRDIQRFQEEIRRSGSRPCNTRPRRRIAPGACLRRTLGPALARRRSLRRIERQRGQYFIPLCVALSRLCRRRVEQRRAIRQVPDGTTGRRPVACQGRRRTHSPAHRNRISGHRAEEPGRHGQATVSMPTSSTSKSTPYPGFFWPARSPALDAIIISSIPSP